LQSGPYGHGRRGELGSGQIPAWEGHESKRRLGENGEGSRVHLLVAWVGCGMTCGGGATGTDGSRRRSAVAAAFWWDRERMAGFGGFRVRRASFWGTQFGRGWGGGQVPRRAQSSAAMAGWVAVGDEGNGRRGYL